MGEWPAFSKADSRCRVAHWPGWKG